MGKPELVRHALFRAALVLHEETVNDVAERAGVSRGHLYAVLDGTRSSRRVNGVLAPYLETARKALCGKKAA